MFEAPWVHLCNSHDCHSLECFELSGLLISVVSLIYLFTLQVSKEDEGPTLSLADVSQELFATTQPQDDPDSDEEQDYYFSDNDN